MENTCLLSQTREYLQVKINFVENFVVYLITRAHTIFFRKPDLDVDPENVKMREITENGSISLDNRFGENDEPVKCGQQLDDRIVGGVICEIDKYF